MKRVLKIVSLAVMAITLLVPAMAQQQSSPSTSNPKATAAGSKDRIAKFIAPGVIGDAYITEDKFGNVGIGTTCIPKPLSSQKRRASLW